MLRFRLCLAPALLAGLIAGCDGPGQPEPGAVIPIGGASGTELAKEQVLYLGNGAEPQTLDPHRAQGVPASDILRDLFEGLTSEAPDGSIVPGVAKSWTVSEDGLTWTFELRRNARWSNGDPLTATDFVYGLRRTVDPRTLSQYSSILYPIENAEDIIRGLAAPETLGVEAAGLHGLIIRLRSPTPYLLGLLTHSTTYPVHQPTVEQFGDRFARAGNLVGNGAYRLEEWAVQSHVKLVRNRHYWDDANTTIDAVHFLPIENQDSELKRYRAGELDITEAVPYNQLGWIRENLGDELVIAPYLGSYYFGFNVTREPFLNQPDLRKALALAIDRDIIVERITGAGEIPAYTWIPPFEGYASPVPEWAGWTQAEREAEARRLYAQAGYSDENPLTVEMLYNTSENHKRICAAIAAMWKKTLGVRTNLANQEWKVFLTTRAARQITQVYRDGWIGDYNDPFTFAQLMSSDNELNYSGYHRAYYDDLLARAEATVDPAARLGLLAEAEGRLIEDMPIIPVYFYVSKHLVKPWVAGYQPNIMDHHYTKHLSVLKH